MPRILRNIVVAHTNDFKTEKQEAIKRWVEANGGCFSKQVTPEVTHLIASMQAWKRYTEPVKQARKLKTHVVKFAWLVESLSPLKPKILDEENYSWERKLYKKAKEIQKAQRRCKLKRSAIDYDCCDSAQNLYRSEKGFSNRNGKQLERAEAQLDKLCNQYKKDMATDGYHLYTDDIGFTYIANLIRQDLLEDEVEKYQLQIYESDASPCAYAVSILYVTQRGGKSPTSVDQVLAGKGSTFDFAFKAFRQFFEKKCELTWENRMNVAVGVGVNLSHSDDKSFVTAGTRRPFSYLPPKLSLSLTSQG